MCRGGRDTDGCKTSLHGQLTSFSHYAVYEHRLPSNMAYNVVD